MAQFDMNRSGSISALAYRDFVNREEMFQRASYNPEVEFYTYVQSGDLARVRELTSVSLLDKREGWGKLSEDDLTNVKYHFIITTALIARYCINGGMPLQTAYNLSDYYIRRADQCRKAEDIAALHPVMCLDYTKRMHELAKSHIVSPYVIKSIEYIYDHLHTRITAEELANHAGVSVSYLSKLFKAETGSSISEYIAVKKIETAKKMLQFSDYSILEISMILAYPSQSYFSSAFRKMTGLTPGQFRRENQM